MIHPCHTPLSILKHSLSLPFTLTQTRLLAYILLIPFSSLPSTSYILSTCHRASLLTLSYAFPKSIKPKYTPHFFFRAFSPNCFRVKIWCTHTLPALKPLAHHLLNPQSLYELYLTGSLYIFLQLRLTTSIINTFRPFSFTLVQWNYHSKSPLFRHNSILKGHITQPLDPLHHPVTSTFHHLSRNLILTCCLSILKLRHSYFTLRSPN